MTIASTSPQPANAEEVRRLCGEIDDSAVAQILALRPSLSDVEAAIAWFIGESDVMGEARLPLSGTAAAVYQALQKADEPLDEDERRR